MTQAPGDRQDQTGERYVGLSDANPVERLKVLERIRDAGTADAETLRVLEACLKDEVHDLRRFALVVLGQLGGPAVPVLARGLGEDQPLAVRLDAAGLLSPLG